MKISIPTRKPFSFEQTKTFIRRFPGCQAQASVGDDAVTGAFSAGGRGWAVTLRAAGDALDRRPTGRGTAVRSRAGPPQ